MHSSAEKLSLIETILRLEDREIISQMRRFLASKTPVRGSEKKTVMGRKAGTMKGLIVHMSDDFDAPLDDFKEYIA